MTNYVSLCQALLFFEVATLFIIMLFGSSLIRMEFQEYILSQDMKYFDNYKVFTYYVEILTHLVIAMVLMRCIRQFRSVQEQNKFIMVILLQFVLFILNLERVQKYEYFWKIHVIYLLNNGIVLYCIMQMLIINQNLQKAKKRTLPSLP